MMSNPLIISLNIKDIFSISYFTNYFLEKLGYSYLELKNQDFHEKLFPGTPDLIKEHTFMMKQFLFFYENVFSKHFQISNKILTLLQILYLMMIYYQNSIIIYAIKNLLILTLVMIK